MIPSMYSMHPELFVLDLFPEVGTNGLGCQVGLSYAGAFGYADDIALIAPKTYSLRRN